MAIAVPLNSIGLLLIVAAVMAMLTRRVGLPYSTGLVAAGILIHRKRISVRSAPVERIEQGDGLFVVLEAPAR